MNIADTEELQHDTRCKNIKTLQVPKSYKAPVFLEQLVAGLSDQGTVSLECKVVVVMMRTMRMRVMVMVVAVMMIHKKKVKTQTLLQPMQRWNSWLLSLISSPACKIRMITKLLLRWLESPHLPCGGSEMGRRLGFQIGTKQI